MRSLEDPQYQTQSKGKRGLHLVRCNLRIVAQDNHLHVPAVGNVH